MRRVGCPVAPSGSLPPLRSLSDLTEKHVRLSLDNLTAIYCPLLAVDATAALPLRDGWKKTPFVDVLAVDSGYASEVDDSDAGDLALEALRADAFERRVAERWLTGFIARAEELPCFACSEESCQRALDQASAVLESFFTSTADEEQQIREELADYIRDFSFDVKEQPLSPIHVRLNDGLASTNSSEPDDVGLQIWGASIVTSKLLCAQPGRFCLTKSKLGCAPRIVDLGAGTGLVSIVLGKLLPRLGVPDATIVATDYHPAVLENLRANIAANFSAAEQAQVQASLVDWSAPGLGPPLDVPADLLFATDVIYAPEHAILLRNCASQLLSPQGIFWLVATVRQNGRFQGVSETVDAAFNMNDRPTDGRGKRLTITQAEGLEKTRGVGRGDESGYKLFRIEWA